MIGFLLVFILVLSSLVFVIAQVPNPGHSWDQMVKDLNLTVDTFANRVGIGTTKPETKLHVSGGPARFEHNANSVQLVGANHVYQEFYPQGVNAGRFAWFGFGENGTEILSIVNQRQSRLDLGTNYTTRLSISGEGRVGIGTTAPQQKLHVHGGSLGFTSSNLSRLEFSIGLDSSERGYEPFLWTQRGQGLRIGVGEAGEVMRITTNGSVGIGTTNPIVKLEINLDNVTGTVGRDFLKVAGGNNDNGRYISINKDNFGVWSHSLNSWANFFARNITAYGNVGIGTENASRKLHLVDLNPGNNSQLIIQDGDRLGWFVHAERPRGGNPSTRLKIFYDNVTGDGNPFATILTLTENAGIGRVGIGILDPQAKLHVSGGAIRPEWGNSDTAGIHWGHNLFGGGFDQAFIRYYSEGGENTTLVIGNENDRDDDISFFQARAERMTIYNGNVGIGTSNPQARLDVNGVARISGDIDLAGSNRWIIHSPDDNNRRTLHIAPVKSDGSDWNWAAQTVFTNDGKVAFSNNLYVRGGGDFTGKLYAQSFYDTEDSSFSRYVDPVGHTYINSLTTFGDVYASNCFTARSKMRIVTIHSDHEEEIELYVWGNPECNYQGTSVGCDTRGRIKRCLCIKAIS